MSNAIRKIARGSINTTCRKENGNNKNFKNKWIKYHRNVIERINDKGETIRTSAKSGISRKKRKTMNVKGFLNNIKNFRRNKVNTESK